MAKKLTNPFKPTAGAEPPLLIGRKRVLEDFEDGLAEGVGSPARLMRITGSRGSGKTVLLTELGDMARGKGWTVVDLTAGGSLVDQLIDELRRGDDRTSISADLDLGIVKAHMQKDSDRASSVRQALEAATCRPSGNPVGLLVTMDEVQDADEDEIREMATAVQHLIRQKRNIAFVFAGITTGVMDLINSKSLTFLRRAVSEELGSIPLEDVRAAFDETIRRSGLDVEEDALDEMAKASGGYAYMIQLVGYHVWRRGRAHSDESLRITKADVDRGVTDARQDFQVTVHEPAIARLPLRAVEYLIAMAEDEGVSSTTEVAKRLGQAPSALTSYRRMLVKSQVIEPTARGYVTFSIPYMREFIIQNSEELLARYGR